MHGKFFWYDIMTTDTAAAAKFYGDVVGWGTMEVGQPDKPYTLFTINGAGVAGLMALPDDARDNGVPPHWSGYIAVDDVDATAAKIKDEGGSIYMEPIDVPDTIRFAVAADPQGATFYVAKGLVKDPPPMPADDTPGTVGWRELYAGEWESAFTFYEKMFGWTKSRPVPMGDMGTYQLFAIDGKDAGGMMTKPPFIPRAHWGYYFNVPEIDAAIARIEAGGGKITHGPVEVPGGQWIVQATDPQGVHFNLVAPPRTAA